MTVSLPRLEKLLVRHEGLKLFPYKCTAGKLTVGVGRNLEDVGITAEESLVLLQNDIARVKRQATTLPWYSKLDEVRQHVILSMIFNMGLTGLKAFKKMLLHIETADFPKASEEMLSSKWAEQVGRRAKDLAFMMRTGEYISLD